MKFVMKKLIVIAAIALGGVVNVRGDAVTATVPAGLEPDEVAIDSVTNMIYVTNNISNTVTVINGATNDTSIVNVGINPSAIAVNPITNMIYVANYGDSSVTAINGSNNTTTKIRVGSGSEGIAINPLTNMIYVANGISNTVTAINGVNNSTATILVGADPWGIVVNPVTNTIYVSNQHDSSVTIINGSNRATSSVTVGYYPTLMAVNAVTNMIYVCARYSNYVTAISGSTKTTYKIAVGTDPADIAVNPNTNTIYATNMGSKNITTINGSTLATTTISVGTYPYGIAVNPVTNMIYVANSSSGTVTAINGSTSALATLTVGSQPYYVAVNSMTNAIYTPNTNSGNVSVITGTPGQVVLAAPSDNAMNVPANVKLSWNTASQATGYTVQVSTGTAFNTTVINSTVTNDTLTAFLMGGTKYYWSVTPFNGVGTSPGTMDSFTTMALPASPSLISPANAATNQPISLGLSWSTSALAASYEVQVSLSSAFGSTILDQSGASLTSTTLSGLANNTTYYWHANATDFGGTSSWSGPWSFTTLAAVAPPPPGLSSPINGSTNVPISLTLAWNTLATASSYNVQLSTDASFGSFIVQDSLLTSGSQIVSGLANNAQYYWRVQAKNAYGTSAWASASFVTVVATPILSAPTYPFANQATSVTLSWTTVVGATNYLVQISTGSNFANDFLQDSSLTTGSRAVAGLVNNQLYYWQVRAKNAGGSSGWSTLGTFTIPTYPPPQVPVLFSPTNGAIAQSISPTLTWSTSNIAVAYRVQVALDSLYSSIVLDDSVVTSGSLAAAGLSNASTYYWRVLSKNIGTASAWSGTWNFTTVWFPPPVPALTSPANGAGSQPITPTLSWSSGGNASLWSVQVSTSSTFSTFAAQDSLLTMTSQALSGLALGTVYYWQVNAKNSGGGVSAWSAAWSFTTFVVAPAAPVLASPTNGAANQPVSLVLAWGTSNFASSYEVEVSLSSIFGTTLFDQTGTSLTSATVSGLSGSATYYWRANALNIGGSKWSNAWSFTTMFVAAPANPPALALPSSGEVNLPVTLTLSWGSVSAANWYGFQLSTSSSFATTLMSQTGIPALTSAVNNLGYSTTYYWEAEAGNAGGTSAWSGVWSFTTIARLAIPMSGGWYMYSLNIHPADSSTNGVFGGLKGFILAMDGSDNLYWPGADLDEIGTIRTGTGYWVLDTLASDTLKLTGSPVDLGSNPIALTASNWNLVSYLPQASMPIATALAPISSQLVLAMDGASNFYWPAASLNEIGTMAVGDGYYIVTSAAVSLTYPAAGSSPAKELSAIPGLAKLANPPAPRHFAKQALTGNFAAFMAPHVEIGDKPAADNCEVGAYDTKGNLAGSGTVVNGLVAFAICGKDPAGKVKNGCLPSEKLTFKLWNGKTEYPLTVTHGSEPVFASRTILKATLAVPAGALISSFNLTRAYPNPFKGVVNIAFDVPTIGGVAQHAIEINIYDMKGALVKQLAKGVYQAGHYELPWNCGEGRDRATVGTSMYIVRMKATNFEKRLKLIRIE
jgi:YVTN family beta-propeller protein